MSWAIDLLDHLDGNPDAEPDADDEPEPETIHLERTSLMSSSRLASATAHQHHILSTFDSRLIAAEAVATAAANLVQHPGTFEALNMMRLALDETTPEAAVDFLRESSTSPLDIHAAAALLDALCSSVTAWLHHANPRPEPAQA